MGDWHGRLEQVDVKRAERLAGRRTDRVKGEGLGPGHGDPRRSDSKVEDDHNVGALAEVAFGIFYDLPVGVDPNEFGSGDFGNMEVRGTAYSPGHLKVFPGDSPENVYCCVVVQPDNDYRFRIEGFATAELIRNHAEVANGKLGIPEDGPRRWVVYARDLLPNPPDNWNLNPQTSE